MRKKTLTISLNGSLKLLNYFKGMFPCVINGKFRVTSYGNVNILSAEIAGSAEYILHLGYSRLFTDYGQFSVKDGTGYICAWEDSFEGIDVLLAQGIAKNSIEFYVTFGVPADDSYVPKFKETSPVTEADIERFNNGTFTEQDPVLLNPLPGMVRGIPLGFIKGLYNATTR